MNIGFDLDGIFIGIPPFIPSVIIDMLYRKQNADKLIYRYPPKIEQYIRKMSHRSIFRPAFEENIAFLKKLAKNNTHKRYLISGRFGFLKKETDVILKKYGISKHFDKQLLNYNNHQPHVFKNKVVKKYNIHMHVDDDLPLLVFLAKENEKVIFYWLNKKRGGEISNNLFAVTQLSDILR